MGLARPARRVPEARALVRHEAGRRQAGVVDRVLLHGAGGTRRGSRLRNANGAVDYARSRGARIVEAYPVDKRKRERDDSMWFGAKSMYDRAGFVEVARRKPARPVVRKA